MYHTARMADITLSRRALAVCITRLAMRPAKSFWKNGQFWRTTCQWLCQRIMLVTPGMSAFWRLAMSADSSRGGPCAEHRPIPARGRAHEVPVESEQARRRRPGADAGRAAYARLEIRQHAPVPDVGEKGCSMAGTGPDRRTAL